MLINEQDNTLLKPLDEKELAVYDALQACAGDPARPLIPAFNGVVEDFCVENEQLKAAKYLCLGNLLVPFSAAAKVMDVKMGVRTFSEGEAAGDKPRPDLYTRLAEMYPHEPTEAERASQAITKFRWMTVRDSQSTTSSLGYRIDGVAGYRRKPKKQMDKEFADFRTRDQTVEAFRTFADVAATNDGALAGASSEAAAHQIAVRFVRRLEQARAALGGSSFFFSHEFVGSSFLLVADEQAQVGVFWIDFAKTSHCPAGLTHCSRWTPGNREDGLLTGLDGLISAWRAVAEQMALRSAPLGSAATSCVVLERATARHLDRRSTW